MSNGVPSFVESNWGGVLPMQHKVYFDDFTRNGIADWVVNAAQAPAGVVEQSGAEMKVYNGAYDASIAVQAQQASFTLNYGVPLLFAARINVPVRYGSSILVGLQIAGQPAMVFRGGIFLSKGVGTDGWTLSFSPGPSDTGASTAPFWPTYSAGNVLDMAFYYDGSDTIAYSVDGMRRELKGISLGQIMPVNVPLSPKLAITSNAIDNPTPERGLMFVDYVFVAQRRRLRF